MTALEKASPRPSARDLERAGQMRLPVYPFVNLAGMAGDRTPKDPR